ncbi:MAG: EscU/YscU/HrcU family type III secretion system export apparatus switch protein [Pseudomonadota bacterium]|nr:EscU/YscU/HrcU family type III secretion system export apparatus switch protein [Pseudomonadota bacterium]MDE3038006.1 EscU/YscU/HrcU family type III secretion system export apparatus switch protein [Pseudomonadota bacterium]
MIVATGSGADTDKLAVALVYAREKDNAPRVAAKGKGYIAQAIIELAQRHGIEVREDTDLAMLLSKFDIDAPIPLEAYAAVAEILAYVYKTNDRMKRHHES